MIVKVFNKNHEKWPFERKTPGASCYDLHADVGVERAIPPGRRWLFRTGIHVDMPAGCEAQVRGRSGLARDYGVVIAPGTIDSDYRGEVSVVVLNLGEQEFKVQPGMRIAQLAFSPVLVDGEYVVTNGLDLGPVFRLVRVDTVEELSTTLRGASGFGSTGT